MIKECTQDIKASNPTIVQDVYTVFKWQVADAKGVPQGTCPILGKYHLGADFICSEMNRATFTLEKMEHLINKVRCSIGSIYSKC